ncbi:MAG: LytR/AlgR family response regulator transcription factor [Chitinophagales bacterium]
MSNYKILIVEDEILIADSLKRYLQKKGHEVVGIAISFDEAEELYLEANPDLVLLDIKLNGKKTGIDFAYFLQQQTNSPLFIYLTSQIDVNTIQNAKKTFPAAYLSKPIRKENLYASIEISMHKQAAKQDIISTISLFDGTKNYIIPIKDILFIQADHIYIKIHLRGGKHILQRSTLRDFLSELTNVQFIQTHRSFVVNIQEVKKWGEDRLYLDGNQAIPISRSRRKSVLSYLRK